VLFEFALRLSMKPSTDTDIIRMIFLIGSSLRRDRRLGGRGSALG